MDTKSWIEIITALVMVIGLAGTFAIRWRLKKGIGRRAIQAMTIILVVPATMLLALEGVLNTQTVAAILGATVGYGLSVGGAKATGE